MVTRRFHGWFGFVGALLLAVQAEGATLPAPVPEVTEQIDHGTYVVHATFVIAASTQTTWEVLTDYDSIPHFVSSMKASQVQSRSGHSLMLAQRLLARVLFISRESRLLLNVHEEPPHLIQFIDTLHADFDLYEGTWTLTPLKSGCQVDYRLEARPRIALPPFLGSDAMRSGSAEMIGQIRTEIVRRSQQPLSSGLPRASQDVRRPPENAPHAHN